MRTIIKLIIGIIILSMIIYTSIVFYFYETDKNSHLFDNNYYQNNCLFNFTNCSYFYSYNVTKAIDNFDDKYDISMNKIRIIYNSS